MHLFTITKTNTSASGFTDPMEAAYLYWVEESTYSSRKRNPRGSGEWMNTLVGVWFVITLIYIAWMIYSGYLPLLFLFSSNEDEVLEDSVLPQKQVEYFMNPYTEEELQKIEEWLAINKKKSK